MIDYAEMADGQVRVPTPQPPYIRYVAWEPTARPKTGPELLHEEVQALRCQVAEMEVALRRMQEAICHLELRMLNQEGEL